MSGLVGTRGTHAPRVSVVASAYRAERFLPGFFASVSAQTIVDEIDVHLVLNDPTAPERAVCAEASEALGHRLIVHEVPREPYGASWNRAARASSGEMIAIWNVDDVRTPDSLEQQVACIDAGADIAFGDFLISRAYGDFVATELVDTSAFLQRDMREGMMLGPFFCVRRGVLEAAGPFDEQLRIAADFDFAIRALCHGRAGRVAGVLGYYLDEGGGLSTDAAGAQRTECAVVQLRYGLMNQLDLRMVRRARSFDLEHIHVGDRRLSVPELAHPDFPLRATWRDRVECAGRQPAHLIRALGPVVERGLRSRGRFGELTLRALRAKRPRTQQP